MNRPTEENFWSRDSRELLAEMGSSRNGLSAAAAAGRLREHGPNTVEDQHGVTTLRLLARQFESPLVLILVFGAIVSMALRDWIDAAIILAIVLGSTLLGFGQEYRATAAVGLRPDGAERPLWCFSWHQFSAFPTREILMQINRLRGATTPGHPESRRQSRI